MGYIRRLWPIIKELGLLNYIACYHFCEEFAGEHAISTGLAAYMYVGKTLDLRIDPHHDFMTRIGYCIVVSAVMSTCEGGIFWAAPPCSTWVWLARHSTGRHLSWAGHAGNEYVHSQNVLVTRLVHILVLCIKRNVKWIVEQPASSTMFEHPHFKWLFKRFGCSIYTISLQMGAFGLEARKDTILIGTADYLPGLAIKMSRLQKDVLKDNKLHLTTRYKDKNGKACVMGGRDLKGTQAYPLNFGAAHARMFHAAQGTIVCDMNTGHALDPDDTESEPEDLAGLSNECFDDVMHGRVWFSNSTGENKLALSAASSSSAPQ